MRFIRLRLILLLNNIYIFKLNIIYLAVGRREGIHQSVAHEVAHIFRGKTAEQLDQLKTQIEKKINSKAEGVDIGYWETLLSQLKGMHD